MINESRKEAVAYVGLSHGPVNAMDIEFCNALCDALDRLRRDDCRAVIVTGHKRVFSAGVDLKRWLNEGPEYVEPFLMRLEAVFQAIFSFPKPIIAVIEGHAIAGGCMMASACDYRIISPEARIGIPELRIGVPLPMMAIEIVRFVATTQAFQRIVHVGATYVGSSAVDVGLADEVCSPDSMTTRSEQVAGEYASIPLPTFQLTKRQVREPILRRVESNRRELADAYMELWQSPATRKSIENYVRERLE